jgi:protoporphyrinogen/coproporphyrinogen III oxidase
VVVYNFIFPPTETPIHPAGFGYLIPRPDGGYEAAKHGMLGVVFDSCALAAQDSGDPGFTKMTVMVGGPYPSWTRKATVEDVLQQLGEQLGGPLPAPVHVERHLHERCIPVPEPGHVGKVEEMRKVLKGNWERRLDIIGAGVGGVSVGDCVRQGKEAGKDWL